MSRYHRLLLFIVALVIAATIVVVTRPIREGLDLAGGMRVVLQAEGRYLPKNPDEKAAKMDAVKKTLVQRVQGMGGVTEPVVQLQGDDRVIIELPGIKDKKRALEDIKTTARLEFYWLKNVQSERNPSAKWEMLTAEMDEKTQTEVYSFRNKATQEIIRGDTDKGREDILLKVVNAYEPDKNPSGDKPLLTGDDLLPKSNSDLDQNARPVVYMKFGPKGARIFGEFTRRHVGDILAIFLGGRLMTAPRINEPIPGGNAQISGGFSDLTEAQRTAQFLNAGALPVPLNIIQLDDVEATLGREVVNQALMAGIIGLSLVAVFMLLYYRLPGLLADIALGIYSLLTFAIFKGMGVTMTLPGLAGFILSIGMAVDANILIFERLKEELKSGKTLRAAIDAGFTRAFTAILDSNVCTIITCLVLLSFATGMVRSFATTLAIGVLISMFTAITVTRTFLHLLVNQKWAQDPRWFGLATSWFARRGRHFNIVGKRNWYFALSGLVIVPGLVFYFANYSKIGSGLRPGIEFKPGTSMQMTFNRPVTVTDVSEIVSSLGVENTAQITKSRTNFTAFIRTNLDPEKDGGKGGKIERIKSALATKIGPMTKEQTLSVGPTVSRELTQKAIMAVILAGVAIVIYLSSRFAIGGFIKGIKYGACAMIATFHDVLVITGLFAITGYFLKWEIDTLFVTAVLTMIGFSTHDTIVVFDRIRENLKHRLKGEGYEELANRSVLQTFARSVNTSFTVVITIVALTAFGGPIIRHFYIALLVGVISGTYSSIFNATPLVVVWEGIASRAAAGGRRRALAEDRPLVDLDRARELRPIAQPAAVTPKDGGTEPEETSAAAKAGRVKVKPKRKKRRF